MTLSAQPVPDLVRSPGFVYTFYSYKGGVGRTMALANVGAILSKTHRVLLVDWDLEAPGLEQFFLRQPSMLEGSRREIPGVVDLIESYSKGEKLDWHNCLLTAAPFGNGDRLWILTAGRESDNYVQRVQTLDLPRLFNECNLGRYLEELRQEWVREFDFVLLDSRTGITDVGGICTILLPDVLVLFVTTTNQSLNGVIDVMNRALRARADLAVDRSRLLGIPVPARDDSQTEVELAEQWRAVFAEKLRFIYDDWLPTGVKPQDVLQQLRIPYVAYWSFSERLPVVEQGTKDPRSIGFAYDLLARLIRSRLDWNGISSLPDERVGEQRVFISYTHDSPAHMDHVLELSNRLRRQGLECWIDQYEQSPAVGWPQWCANQVSEAAFVLMVCTETYARRFEGDEEEGQGKGVSFEGCVITQAIYNKQGKNKKFIPVAFSSKEFEHIPILLDGPSRYDLSDQEQYQALYWRLTGQSRKPGPVREVIQRVFGQSSKESPGNEPLQKLERKQTFSVGPSTVPPPSPYFTGRQDILRNAQEKLARSKSVALSGMGGVGKTQIAKQYAQSHRKDYSRIFWARAEKPETLVADFGAIAQLLDLPEKDEKDQSAIVAAVKYWLETNSGWLLILDNADDIPLAQDFLPASHEGRVLLTSTASAFGGWAEKIPVEQMNPDEAALLLLRRAGVIGKEAQAKDASQADGKLAYALAEQLGGLPLALDQVGAFIEETPSTLAEYTQFYEKEGKRLRELRGGLSSDHPSVTVTFSLAFHELAVRDALAASLVRLCAFLAPNSIPEEIFTKGASALGPEFARRAENPIDFANTVKQAATFSLLRRDAPDRSLDIHRLVQEVLKDEMNPEQLREWAERAVRAVDGAFPAPDFRNWPDCARLLPHAKACAALIDEFSFQFAEGGRLLNRMASYMKERAQYVEAEALYQRSLAIYEESLGPEHSDVAQSLNDLAVLYDNQERYAEAEPLYQRSLAIREKALGPDHPNVATVLNNLALLYNNQARYAEAEPFVRKSLAIGEKELGLQHPDVATSLNNLALLYHNQRRHTEAEPLYQRALAIREKILGPNHPDVASSLNNLAALYWAQGRYLEAESLYQRALAIREKALGPEHPAVATSLNNLAGLYDAQRRFADSEPLFRRSLAILEKALGPGHPNVATALENYAVLLRKIGRKAEALPLETRAKTIREKMKQQVKP